MNNAYLVLGAYTYGFGEQSTIPGDPGLLDIGNITLTNEAEVSNTVVKLAAGAGLLAKRYPIPPISETGELYVNDVLVFTGSVIEVALDDSEMTIRLAL